MLKKMLPWLLLLMTKPLFSKSISLSFDDIPRKNSYLAGTIRSKRIIESLAHHKVQAIFYVNSSKVSQEGLNRIRSYADSGHIIGNHTHSHPSADMILQDVFLEDFKTGDRLLKSWGFKPTWFRYPYLHRGKSLDQINAIRKEILSLGYGDGFVTIDNYDWYMDAMFQKAVSKGRTINFEQLKKFYVETLYNGIAHYESLAQKVYHRSPSHVLLLHENDLAALFIGDLMQHLKSNGWTICTPEESYKDESLLPFPSDIQRHGQGRVVAHATQKKFPKPLISGLEDEEVLEKIWQDYQIVKD